MGTEVTTDGDGNVVAQHTKPRTYTLSYARKIPKDGGYGAGEEVSLFAQVDVTNEDDDATIEAKLKADARFIKTFVLTQLGVSFTVDSDGIVRGGDVEAAASAARQAPTSSRGAAPRSRTNVPRSESRGGRPPSEVVELAWQQLLASPNDFYDNRPKKESGQYKSNASDFKRKSDGLALWLNTAPDDVVAQLNLAPLSPAVVGSNDNEPF